MWWSISCGLPASGKRNLGMKCGYSVANGAPGPANSRRIPALFLPSTRIPRPTAKGSPDDAERLPSPIRCAAPDHAPRPLRSYGGRPGRCDQRSAAILPCVLRPRYDRDPRRRPNAPLRVHRPGARSPATRRAECQRALGRWRSGRRSGRRSRNRRCRVGTVPRL